MPPGAYIQKTIRCKHGNKTFMKIEIRAFSGIAPRFSPELLNDQNGQTAVNLSIKSGKIHPENEFSFSAPDRDYVTGQINDDQYNRLYFLDKEGTLCMYYSMPEDPEKPGSGVKWHTRKVNLPIPQTPTLDSKSSPFIDSINTESLQKSAMIANYKTTSWKAEEGIATHIYAERDLKPISEWKENGENTLERDYEYNPWTTRIFYPEERA
jgi:hypothetical protein